ncbi:MAG: hypothetical protein J4F48_12210, partial [Nitrospinae bacterium]|nr:hypothetical protein [Nitrospinota bacterium]
MRVRARKKWRANDVRIYYGQPCARSGWLFRSRRGPMEFFKVVSPDEAKSALKGFRALGAESL